ncbi:hypothetical protein CDD81_6585 [Ophiocordyceps australis]|uniref:Uncharacterized protein n=1 Tax=Ophiocordyceps australis TaxID=1399860 RepID=A0A2C5Y2G1_9HYPO|nr:hypothetical protein CDD81_6585 [Ophiocordyceps australis]
MKPCQTLVVAAALSNGAMAAPTFGLAKTAFDATMGMISSVAAPFLPPPSNEEIERAQMGWRNDTMVVSRFLSTAETMSPQQLSSEASIALDAELDELTHKKVLDRKFTQGFGQDQVVLQANNVLEGQQTFQFVVDGLKDFKENGETMPPQEVSRKIRAINTDRCGQVLPSIDKYMTAAAGVLQQPEVPKAYRPTNC